MKKTTFILKFFRNRRILDLEIHPDWESAASRAVDYVNCFSTMSAATAFELLIQEWQSILGPLTWSDGEYEIFLDSHESRYSYREDNVCKVIEFPKNNQNFNSM